MLWYFRIIHTIEPLRMRLHHVYPLDNHMKPFGFWFHIGSFLQKYCEYFIHLIKVDQEIWYITQIMQYAKTANASAFCYM